MNNLCCISNEKQKEGFRYQAMTRGRFLEFKNPSNALEVLTDKYVNNLTVLKATIQQCSTKNWGLRVSSSLLPLYTLPDLDLSLDKLPKRDKILSLFQECAVLAQKTRLSCHPDQFVVLASEKPEVVSNSIRDLEYHGLMMDLLGKPRSYECPINLHINCFKDRDLKDVANRFVDNYNRLSSSVKSRLVIENEDKPNSWSVVNLLKYIHSATGIPITYDSHHFRLNNPDNLLPAEAFNECAQTWGNIKPLFHFSNGKTSPTDRSHADYVNIIHEELFNDAADIDFEFKMKDDAISMFERSKV